LAGLVIGAILVGLARPGGNPGVAVATGTPVSSLPIFVQTDTHRDAVAHSPAVHLLPAAADTVPVDVDRPDRLALRHRSATDGHATARHPHTDACPHSKTNTDRHFDPDSDSDANPDSASRSDLCERDGNSFR